MKFNIFLLGKLRNFKIVSVLGFTIAILNLTSCDKEKSPKQESDNDEIDENNNQNQPQLQPITQAASTGQLVTNQQEQSRNQSSNNQPINNNSSNTSSNNPSTNGTQSLEGQQPIIQPGQQRSVIQTPEGQPNNTQLDQSSIPQTQLNSTQLNNALPPSQLQPSVINQPINIRKEPEQKWKCTCGQENDAKNAKCIVANCKQPYTSIDNILQWQCKACTTISGIQFDKCMTCQNDIKTHRHISDVSLLKKCEICDTQYNENDNSAKCGSCGSIKLLRKTKAKQCEGCGVFFHKDKIAKHQNGKIKCAKYQEYLAQQEGTEQTNNNKDPKQVTNKQTSDSNITTKQVTNKQTSGNNTTAKPVTSK